MAEAVFAKEVSGEVEARKMIDDALVRRINLLGSDSLRRFGGVYEGAYYLQQVPEEAAELIGLLKGMLSHPRLLEVGSTAGGFAKLLDDELACASIHVIDDNQHPQHVWRNFRIPHLTGEYVGKASQAGPWLQSLGQQFDLMVIDTDHVYDHELEHTALVLPYLAAGGVLVFHDALLPEVSRLAAHLKAGAFPGLEHVADIGQKLGYAVFRKAGRHEPVEFRQPQATLLFHFAPWLGRPKMIDLHVRMLNHYLPQFNKVRINFATGDGWAQPEDIQRRLNITAPDVKIFCTPNTKLGETPAFFNLLLPETQDDENVCYAHTKGVIRSPLPWGSVWAELMYGHVLQNSRAAAAVLQTHPCMGAFIKLRNLAGCSWHYSGTFFWFKGLRAFANWQPHQRNLWAVERWLGGFIPVEKAWQTLGFPLLKAFNRDTGGLMTKYCDLCGDKPFDA
jgi:hypothetical protein